LIVMLEKTFIRQGLNIEQIHRFLGPVSNYLPIFSSLSGNPSVVCYLARHPSKGVGAIRVGMKAADGTFYDWLAGNDPDHFQHGSSSFLVSEILHDLRLMGMQRFDFGGANTPKIADFKQGFNGELVMPIQTLWESNSPYHVAIRSAGRFKHEAFQVFKRLKKSSGW